MPLTCTSAAKLNSFNWNCENNKKFYHIPTNLSSVFCPLASGKRLRPAGAGYSFCQDSMNFFQQAAGLHASGK
jgi:hypothetical protein